MMRGFYTKGLVVLFGLALAVLLWLRLPPPHDVQEASSGAALIGGHFTLVDTHGQQVTEHSFSGHPMLIYFGYTHCPDMCPTALLVMQNALAALADRAAPIIPIFITLDPARDTPAVMKEYLTHFDARFVGLTGSAAQIQQVADAYKVYYSIPASVDSANGYSVDHSGFIYLMGADGAYVMHFPHNVSADKLHAALAKFLR